MKRKDAIFLIFFLFHSLLLLPASLVAKDKGHPVNLVQNPGFESKESSWDLKGAAKSVSSEAHTGKYSLYYSNFNPKAYRLFTQSIIVKPGQQLVFSAWLKGKNITTKNLWAAKGAGIYIQGYDDGNKYIEGAFPFCLTGTFNWQQIKGIYIVPENVTRITVGLYMRRQTTGAVWFDDISVSVVSQPVFEAFLKYPNYRGMTMVDDDHPWQLLIRDHVPSGWGKTTLKNSLFDAKNHLLFTEAYSPEDGKPSSRIVSWKHPEHMKPGQYFWRLGVISPDGKESLKKEIPIQVVQEMPEVYIDDEGFTRVAGKRFFPLGIYLGKGPKQGNWASSNDNLERISQTGFNTILSYYYGDREDASDYLKNAKVHGLSVIYNLADIYDGGPDYTKLNTPASKTADSLIDKLKNNSNLLAWYTVDELGSGQVFPVEERYQQIIQSDQDHPVFQVNNDLQVLPLFYNSTDVAGTDPYPVSGNNFTSLVQVSSWTERTVQASMEIKPVWEVLQIFDKNYAKADLPSHPPTLDEMRNMSYQALIHGAKGLIYYAYHWLWYGRNEHQQKTFSEANFNKRWPDVQKMIGEIKDVTPFILSGRHVRLSSVSDSGVQYQAWQTNNKIMLILANPENKKKTLSLKIPIGWNPVNNELKNVKIQFKDHKLQLQFSPLASGTLFLTK